MPNTTIVPQRSLFLAIKIVLSLLLAIAVIVGGFFSWQHYYPVVAKGAWSYKVAHDKIEKASALFKDSEGNLIVAEELNNSKGRIISISPNGERTVLFNNLNKPDGIEAFNGGFVFSQEGGTYPVSWLYQGKLHSLFEGTNVQGLKADGQYLYAVEDRGINSRILRYDSITKNVEILRENLNQAENLAICPNGLKFYNEKKKHVVRLLTEDNTDPDPVILDEKQLREPSFLHCDAKGLWISEDSTHRARLLLLKPNGKLKVIFSHLKAPQQLLSISENKYLLAEGGRDRVLEIREDNLID